MNPHRAVRWMWFAIGLILLIFITTFYHFPWPLAMLCGFIYGVVGLNYVEGN